MSIYPSCEKKMSKGTGTLVITHNITYTFTFNWVIKCPVYKSHNGIYLITFYYKDGYDIGSLSITIHSDFTSDIDLVNHK